MYVGFALAAFLGGLEFIGSDSCKAYVSHMSVDRMTYVESMFSGSKNFE